MHFLHVSCNFCALVEPLWLTGVVVLSDSPASQTSIISQTCTNIYESTVTSKGKMAQKRESCSNIEVEKLSFVWCTAKNTKIETMLDLIHVHFVNSKFALCLIWTSEGSIAWGSTTAVVKLYSWNCVVWMFYDCNICCHLYIAVIYCILHML